MPDDVASEGILRCFSGADVQLGAVGPAHLMPLEQARPALAFPVVADKGHAEESGAADVGIRASRQRTGKAAGTGHVEKGALSKSAVIIDHRVGNPVRGARHGVGGNHYRTFFADFVKRAVGGPMEAPESTEDK